MQENLSEVAEKLVTRLTETCADELRRALAAELKPALEAELRRARNSAVSGLAGDLARLLQAASQVDILTVLLQATQPFAERAGLLILREGTYIGWQSRGMKDASAFTRVSIPAADRIMERVAKERQPVSTPGSELAAGLRAIAPSGEAEVWLLPLVIRDRVAGVIYADAGEAKEASPVQAESVCALILTACAAIEVGPLRKPAASTPVQPAPPPQRAEQSDVQPSSVQPATVVQPRAVVATPEAERATAASAVQPPPEASPEDELRTKARRFAKLLVEEIQLYNRAKVAEGRAKQDIYDRLKDDIEKSRATYQRRFGASFRGEDFFTEELVRILADNDRALLGGSFPG